MDKNDGFLPRPINTVLEGCKNYLSWSQAMHSFLKGCMLSLTSSTSALACVVADITCLCQPLTSSFDLEGLTVDFSPGLTFSVQVLLTQFFA